MKSIKKLCTFQNIEKEIGKKILNDWIISNVGLFKEIKIAIA